MEKDILCIYWPKESCYGSIKIRKVDFKAGSNTREEERYFTIKIHQF